MNKYLSFGISPSENVFSFLHCKPNCKNLHEQSDMLATVT